MTLRDDIDNIFNAASERIESQAFPRGMTPENAPDLRWVTVNVNNQALVDAIKLVADKVDQIEARSA